MENTLLTATEIEDLKNKHHLGGVNIVFKKISREDYEKNYAPYIKWTHKSPVMEFRDGKLKK